MLATAGREPQHIRAIGSERGGRDGRGAGLPSLVGSIPTPPAELIYGKKYLQPLDFAH
jgi:hypothetical protein